MYDESLIVAGFVFSSYQEAQIAIREQKNVETIKARTDLSDAHVVFDLYQKLIERKMFQTMIGYSFLYELRQLLTQEFEYLDSDLPSIVLPKRMEYDKVGALNQGVLDSKVQRLLVVKKRLTVTVVILLVMIVLMFVITALNPNVGYVNTENKILNKYSAWQEELEQRERVVREKEAELNINPDQQVTD